MIAGVLREVARSVQAGWAEGSGGTTTTPEPDTVNDMAKKGKKQRKRQARQVELDRQRAAHQETWKAAWSSLQDGSGMQEETEKLRRPAEKCKECSLTFLEKDSFHYSVNGPIHGWGSFEEVETCKWLKQRKDNNSGNGSGWNRCLECEETVMSGEPSHSVKGGKIHGNGSWRDRGTCLIRHRQDLGKKLGVVSEEFFDGKLSAEDVRVVIEATIEEETRMATYLESVDTTHKPDHQTPQATLLEPANTLVYSSETDDTQEFEVIRPAQETRSHG